MNRGAKARAYQQSQPELAKGYTRRREHAIQRAHERYGLEMSIDEYERLCAQMPDKKSEEKFLARRVPHPKEKGDVRFYAVFWRRASRWVLAPYSFKSFQIVTFLPAEHLPQGLPNALDVHDTLARGARAQALRETLGDKNLAPYSVNGDIAWSLVEMEAPESVTEARIYLKYIGDQLYAIQCQLANATAHEAEHTVEEHKAWKRKAKWAAIWRRAQISTLKAYIALMEARAARVGGCATDPETWLAQVIVLVRALNRAGRVTLEPEEWQIINGARQCLRDIGHKSEQEQERAKA